MLNAISTSFVEEVKLWLQENFTGNNVNVVSSNDEVY